VPVSSVAYYTGGQEEPGRAEKIALQLPPEIRVEPIAPTQTLSAMLAAGDIDAIYAPRTPSTFCSAPDRVRRLFADYESAEREYFRQTRIFPIMHTLVIRRDVYQRNRWVAQSLYKAWCAAQRETYRDLGETAALKTMLPWLVAHVEQTRREMGAEFWPYGLEPNRTALATFLRYSYEQGLSQRLLTADELFAPETLEAFRI
jgi:4,5-dihydroxyphthalate decarboxylase